MTELAREVQGRAESGGTCSSRPIAGPASAANPFGGADIGVRVDCPPGSSYLILTIGANFEYRIRFDRLRATYEPGEPARFAPTDLRALRAFNVVSRANPNLAFRVEPHELHDAIARNRIAADGQDCTFAPPLALVRFLKSPTPTISDHEIDCGGRPVRPPVAAAPAPQRTEPPAQPAGRMGLWELNPNGPPMLRGDIEELRSGRHVVVLPGGRRLIYSVVSAALRRGGVECARTGEGIDILFLSQRSGEGCPGPGLADELVLELRAAEPVAGFRAAIPEARFPTTQHVLALPMAELLEDWPVVLDIDAALSVPDAALVRFSDTLEACERMEPIAPRGGDLAQGQRSIAWRGAVRAEAIVGGAVALHDGSRRLTKCAQLAAFAREAPASEYRFRLEARANTQRRLVVVAVAHTFAPLQRFARPAVFEFLKEHRTQDLGGLEIIRVDETGMPRLVVNGERLSQMDEDAILTVGRRTFDATGRVVPALRNLSIIRSNFDVNPAAGRGPIERLLYIVDDTTEAFDDENTGVLRAWIARGVVVRLLVMGSCENWTRIGVPAGNCTVIRTDGAVFRQGLTSLIE